MQKNIIILIVLIAVVFGIARFSGLTDRTISKNFNIAEGTHSVTTADAAASDNEVAATGEAEAAGSVRGIGTATAENKIGHEFKYTGGKPQEFEVSIDFHHSSAIEVIDTPAEALARIRVVLEAPTPAMSQSKRITRIATTTVAVIKEPSAGTQRSIEKFKITLQPNESFKIYVASNIRSHAPGGALGGATSRTEVDIRNIRLQKVR